MAFSKARQFDPLTFHQSFWSKALAHPARIIIVLHLLDHGTTPFQVLWRKLPLARSTVSQHLNILREAGIINAKEKFPHTYYNLNNEICKSLVVKLNFIQQEFLKSTETS